MDSWLLLLIILIISLVSKNNTLIISSLVVITIKLLPFTEKLFNFIDNKGLNLGIIIISITIFTPIAMGKIGFKDLIDVFKTPLGWIAICCGIITSILSKWGVNQLSSTPQMTVAIILGTIIGTVFLKGIATGPIISSGIVYLIFMLLHLHF